ncbi:riboflavin synthase [Nakamurella antarctica]|uniref:Riboflavin synthase n=1 Tax=Nakamurella antarctica TaxID=1902245 RepID=A0A3G8ZU65_9ACTN|nr:riboflavin synthase [Nakamurella antarctica]AZI57556.1 riboflavin synthase [Nakamurella antarctica]
MFTGIVEERGEIIALAVAADGKDARITVRGPLVTTDAGHGDSIAVSGVCLTVVDQSEGTFTADVMAETLIRTTVGALKAGDFVNLERSVTAATRLGGHVVQGHVDGIGQIMSHVHFEAYDEIRISVPVALGKYIASKGSIAVDGISLTVIDVADTARGSEFTVGIIPETREATTLGRHGVAALVNIEVDVMAKYVERLLTAHPGLAEPLVASVVDEDVHRNQTTS